MELFPPLFTSLALVSDFPTESLIWFKHLLQKRLFLKVQLPVPVSFVFDRESLLMALVYTSCLADPLAGF